MKKFTLADLHIHSCASDGTATPKQILEIAKSKSIDLISLTDHNIISNSKKIRELAKSFNISIIDGVEIDISDNGICYHMLGYGIDLNDVKFSDFLENINCKLTDNNTLLIKRMCKNFPKLNYDEYLDYSYDRTLGGWESINYLIKKGVTSSQREGLTYYSIYNCTPDEINFPSFRETIDQIHSAGGYAVLAHPGDYFDNDDNFSSNLDALLKSAFDSEVDGIECYYYKHDETTTKACLDFCRENNLMITGGCDYHGAFISNSDIGKMIITEDMLYLGSII